MSRQFQINAPSVVAEVIDGEAVIMNLASGHYFSTQGVGALVWTQLTSGVSESEIRDMLAARYGIASGDAAAATAAFVSDLEQHELVVPRVLPFAGTIDVADQAQGAWSAPVLNVFTDMEDLLLLDPIHDVSEAGWPMPKATDDAAG